MIEPIPSWTVLRIQGFDQALRTRLFMMLKIILKRYQRKKRKAMVDDWSSLLSVGLDFATSIFPESLPAASSATILTGERGLAGL